MDPVRQLIAVPRADLISHLGTTLLEQERLSGKKGYSFTMQTCLHQFNSTPQESFRKEVEGKKKDYFSLPREAVKYGIQKMEKICTIHFYIIQLFTVNSYRKVDSNAMHVF